MTYNTICLAEEQQRPTLLTIGHGLSISARELVEGRIGEDEREFKFSNGACEHVVSDRGSIANRGEGFSKKSPVLGHAVQAANHFVANCEVVAGKCETCCLYPLSRRNKRLSDKQVWFV